VADPNVEYVHGDLFEWEPPEGVRFDLIFFGFFISHIPPARFDEFWNRLVAWLAPGGRVFFCDDVAGAEGRPSNPGEPVDDGPDFAHRRRLLDGREYTIVKVFHRPDGLTTALASLGWDADIRTTGPEFYYGVATVRGAPSR
jgi:demethylmenaquinone methyltransferase/2-methoxy-6-polyprenyl-1,4-benzoquinol methylase